MAASTFEPPAVSGVSASEWLERQDLVSNSDERVPVTPLLVDGRIYLRASSGLWCFGQ
jgi:hypothetical protein